jgi:hypothetical protein
VDRIQVGLLFVAGASLIVTVVLYYVAGDAAASLAGEKYGMAIKVGGTPAVWVILAWILHTMMEQMYRSQQLSSVSLAIRRSPTPFPRRPAEEYICRGFVYNRETDTER